MEVKSRHRFTSSFSDFITRYTAVSSTNLRTQMGWWRSHQSEMDKKAYNTLVCQQCGKEFVSYGNKGRKFCSRECYRKHRREAAGAVFGR